MSLTHVRRRRFILSESKTHDFFSHSSNFAIMIRKTWTSFNPIETKIEKSQFSSIYHIFHIISWKFIVIHKFWCQSWKFSLYHLTPDSASGKDVWLKWNDTHFVSNENMPYLTVVTTVDVVMGGSFITVAKTVTVLLQHTVACRIIYRKFIRIIYPN